MDCASASARAPTHSIMTRFFVLPLPAVLVGALGIIIPLLPAAEPYDLLIVNGTVIDGSGAPGRTADIGIRGDTLAAIGDLRGAAARRTIDARGLIVAPGFIDMHSHSDYPLLADGTAQSKIRQGVTTEVLGESLSAGPITGQARRPPVTYGVTADWTTLGGYFERLERQGISVNVVTYVGSLQIRDCVLGLETDRAPDTAELAEMRRLVRQAMEDGAFGLSSALTVPPQTYVTHEELVAEASEVRAFGGIYATHTRSGAGNWFGLKEAIEIGRKAGVPVEIVHLNNTNRANWGKVGEIRDLIDAARASGVRVTASRYPYIAGQNNLRALVPPWGLAGSNDEVLARLRDPAARRRMERDIYEGIPGWFNHYLYMQSWDTVRVAVVNRPANQRFLGKSVAEIATLTGTTPTDAVFDLLLAENGTVPAVYFMMSEDDVRETLRLPWVTIGSDGLALRPEGVLGAGKPHPRSYGTFPRVLGKYVREEKVLSLPEALHKMSGLCAAKLGLTDRGLLRPGLKADLAVFNAATVTDHATFDEPHRYSTGIEHVIVNGTLVLENGEHTGARPGRALRKNRQPAPLPRT